MNYRLSQNGSNLDIELSGEITFSENMKFREMLKEIKRQSPTETVFDLSNVHMVDSAGLGMFLIAREQAEEAGWKIRVRGATGHVASMLKLTRLSDLFDG